MQIRENVKNVCFKGTTNSQVAVKYFHNKNNALDYGMGELTTLI